MPAHPHRAEVPAAPAGAPRPQWPVMIPTPAVLAPLAAVAGFVSLTSLARRARTPRGGAA